MKIKIKVTKVETLKPTAGCIMSGGKLYCWS
jgi:hypothetical protein